MKALWLSQLLDLHLTRSIEKHGKEEPMSKFKALADAVKQDLVNFDQQADELMAEREELRRAGEETFSRYREHHKNTREGLDSMRQAIADMAGSNSQGKSEGSDDSGNTFPKGERG